MDLDNLTQQECFDLVATHLLKQGVVAVNVHHNCRFRGVAHNGLTTMCAAGCAITDEEYHPDMEGKSFDRLFLADGTPFPRFTGMNQPLWVDLMVAHDNYMPRYKIDACQMLVWKEKMITIAQAFGLSDKIIKDSIR